MPLFEYRCPAQHVIEHYYHAGADVPLVRPCSQCQREAQREFPLPNVLNYFSESNGRVIQNIDPTVPIHSHAQHQRMMKERGLEPATQWHVSDMKISDGLKTTAKPEHPGKKVLG